MMVLKNEALYVNPTIIQLKFKKSNNTGMIMPNQLHYRVNLYFETYSELEFVLQLAANKIPKKESTLEIDPIKRKLTADFKVPFEKKNTFEKMWDTAVSFASSGMILIWQDGIFEDLICGSRVNIFNAKRPSIIIFSIAEYEKSFGKLEFEIPEIIYESPFYIYDQSLKNKGPRFDDEIPINDADCKLGFQIIKEIWMEKIATSTTFLLSTVFKKTAGSRDDTYTLAPTYGFAPGYNLDSAIKTAKKQNFMAVRWDEFWNDNLNQEKN